MDKKLQIIYAAMKLLTENGVQATPMSAIAKEANAGMGTIYNYYPTKEELINAIYIFIKEDEVKQILVPFSDVSIKKQFDHYYAALIGYLLEKPLHFHFMDQFHNSPIITLESKEEGARSFSPFIHLLNKGQEQGIVKSIGIDELMQFLNGGLMGFVRWILSSDKKINQALLDNQLRIAWDAIKQ